MKKIFAVLLLITMGHIASANEIYITQIGDNLDLDITQDGQNNEVGDSTTDMILNGDDMTFSITQTGDTNTIDATIKGTDYTGTWQFTGNSNTVDLLCSSTATGNCDTVTLNITTNGDSNTFDIQIGETNTADGASVTFTIDGDGNVLLAEVDGEDATVNVTVDNSASLATGTNTDSTTTYTTGQGGVLVEIDQSGNGDVNGHSVTLDITGGGSSYTVTQSGIYDNKVDGTFTGDNQDVDITQSD